MLGAKSGAETYVLEYQSAGRHRSEGYEHTLKNIAQAHILAPGNPPRYKPHMIQLLRINNQPVAIRCNGIKTD
jgi:hypothetical protein